MYMSFLNYNGTHKMLTDQGIAILDTANPYIVIPSPDYEAHYNFFTSNIY